VSLPADLPYSGGAGFLADGDCGIRRSAGIGKR
jgi:hypothetical protein